MTEKEAASLVGPETRLNIKQSGHFHYVRVEDRKGRLVRNIRRFPHRLEAENFLVRVRNIVRTGRTRMNPGDRYRVQARWPRETRWTNVATYPDADRAKMDAIKRARLSETLTYRVRDTETRRVLWQGSGAQAKWAGRRPAGMVGANARKPKITFSQYRDNYGVIRYTVLYGATPVCAAFEDKARALAVLEQTKKEFPNLEVWSWDGEKGIETKRSRKWLPNPIRPCRTGGKPGFQWGGRGKCYTGPGARAKAGRQAAAAHARGFRENAQMYAGPVGPNNGVPARFGKPMRYRVYLADPKGKWKFEDWFEGLGNAQAVAKRLSKETLREARILDSTTMRIANRYIAGKHYPYPVPAAAALNPLTRDESRALLSASHKSWQQSTKTSGSLSAIYTGRQMAFKEVGRVFGPKRERPTIGTELDLAMREHELIVRNPLTPEESVELDRWARGHRARAVQDPEARGAARTADMVLRRFGAMKNPHLKIGSRVRRTAPHGWASSLVYGPILTVVAIEDHRPIDGPVEKNALAILSDGSREFVWNLTLDDAMKNPPKKYRKNPKVMYTRPGTGKLRTVRGAVGKAVYVRPLRGEGSLVAQARRPDDTFRMSKGADLVVIAPGSRRQGTNPAHPIPSSPLKWEMSGSALIAHTPVGVYQIRLFHSPQRRIRFYSLSVTIKPGRMYVVEGGFRVRGGDHWIGEYRSQQAAINAAREDYNQQIGVGRGPTAEAFPNAMVSPEERRRLVGTPVTLDGRPAKISGINLDFPVVRTLDGRLQAEWSWDAVRSIVAKGGRFRMNPPAARRLAGRKNPGDLWVVTRDGKRLAGFATEPEAFGWLLKHQSQSVDWAVRHEGYDIVLLKNGRQVWSYSQFRKTGKFPKPNPQPEHFSRKWVRFGDLTFSQQQEARRRFSPKGRREGWENIEWWAFSVNKDGTLSKYPYIEPVGPRKTPKPNPPSELEAIMGRREAKRAMSFA